MKSLCCLQVLREQWKICEEEIRNPSSFVNAVKQKAFYSVSYMWSRRELVHHSKCLLDWSLVCIYNSIKKFHMGKKTPLSSNLLMTVESLLGKYIFVLFSFQNYFARNFYNMRMLALFVAFAINFILLFYKVNFSKYYFSSWTLENIWVL